uniref:Uncharacterized protein n=1 Tax=Panagrolaimus superbus TaxID=310955 RepID=A0A914XV38_9BILA
MSDDPKLKWMYDGPKADVHREDFLLGKQLTKDFELYSDVARKDVDAAKSEAIDKSFIKSVTHSSNRHNKVSALGLDVVMHEDPLVAIKTKAELRKREIYDNPAIQMKLRKALLEEYQHDKKKKEKKKAKKEKKHERKNSRIEEERSSRRQHHHGNYL